MKKEITATGKDLLEAKANARLLLGASEEDDVTYTIEDLGSKGILGIIGQRPVKIRASIEVADEQNLKVRVERPEKPQKQNNKKKAPKTSEPNEIKEVLVDQTVVMPEVHFETVDVQAGDDKAFDFVSTLVSNLGLTDVKLELHRLEDGSRRVNIVGENASLLIGHHGETLDAVQYLANLATLKRDEDIEKLDRSRVSVDVEGYRQKREETLRKLARRMANKALQKGSKVTLEPMTPYERRIIHSEIQSIEGVTTQSIGQDNNRRIVIYVEKKKNNVAEVVAPEEV